LPKLKKLFLTCLAADAALFVPMFAPSASAQTSTVQVTPSGQPQIKIEAKSTVDARKTGISAVVGANKPVSKTADRVIEADHLEGIANVSATAVGNVVVSADNVVLNAKTVTYNQETDIAVAEGAVRINRDGDVITGEKISLGLESQIGTINNPTFFLPRNTLPYTPIPVIGSTSSSAYKRGVGRIMDSRGSASRIDLEGPEQEHLFDATYTTCKANENEWFLKMQEITLDHKTAVGTGLHGTVEFKGLPILYLPFVSFPLNGERKNGFLPPSFGSSTKTGFEFALPYYFNLAANRDATLTPKIFTKRGLQLGGEFRYLEPNYLGQFDAEYLPSDQAAKSDRFLAKLNHVQNFSDFNFKNWVAAINVQKVSDDSYFRDLSTRIANTSQTNLPRDFLLSNSSAYGVFTARHLSYQTLQDPVVPIIAPYRLAPSFTFNAEPIVKEGFIINAVNEFTDFRHPTLVNGKRLLLYPSVSYPITRSYGFLTPKLGYHFTKYRLGDNDAGFEAKTRTLPIASVDSGLVFERPVNFASSPHTQTLEPRLFYLQVPYREQSRLPIFTTSQTDFNFAQIFNENLFIGGDRISDAKQLTGAVTTRFIENSTGIERLRAAVGTRYYFSPQRVGLADLARGVQLSGNSQETSDGTQFGQLSRSDLLAAVSAQPLDAWYFDSAFQYSTTLKQFKKANISARYNPETGKIVNIAYRFNRDTANSTFSTPLSTTVAAAGIKQLDLSAQWPLGPIVGNSGSGWTILARANHSFQDRRLIEGLLGVEYNQGCWEFRMLAHRFTTATNVYSTSVQIQLELKGLSKLGVNPLETLRQNIPGYRRSSDVPNAAQNETYVSPFPN
jgi:LPS-assembly protein